ncbi:MAG: family 16 glycosylhydrolase [Hyphomonas sp.]
MTGSGTFRAIDGYRIGTFALVAALVLGVLFVAVNPRAPEPQAARSAAVPPARVSDRPVAGSFVHHFGSAHDPVHWYKSDFQYPDSDHPAWKADLIHFKHNRIELEVRRERVADKTIAGAEYQRRGFYHYGRYEVVMKPAKGSGTVSAMFTHTHGQFGDPHDEIDIEFLGNRPRELHLNYFTNGRPIGSIYVPLGFDASEEAHLYAFEWEPEAIRWYVGDRLIYTATPADHPIPQAPGRLMVHLWSGGANQIKWHGRPTFKDGVRASVYCLSHQAAGDASRQCSDTFRARAK